MLTYQWNNNTNLVDLSQLLTYNEYLEKKLYGRILTWQLDKMDNDLSINGDPTYTELSYTPN